MSYDLYLQEPYMREAEGCTCEFSDNACPVCDGEQEELDLGEELAPARAAHAAQAS